jgi:hypothetical protein
MTRPQAIMTAQQLWANGDGGWTVEAIRRYLIAQGQRSLSWSKVKCWVDEEYAAEYRRKDADRQRRLHRDRSGTTRFLILDADARERLGLDVPPTATPEVLLALRLEDGLTYGAIAKVAARFLGLQMTEDEARHRLNALGAPKNPNKARRAA